MDWSPPPPHLEVSTLKYLGSKPKYAETRADILTPTPLPLMIKDRLNDMLNDGVGRGVVARLLKLGVQ